MNTGSQRRRARTHHHESGAVCSPGSGAEPRAKSVTATNAVWCHKKIRMADRFVPATTAQTSGRRASRVSGPRSSRASPTWASPKLTATRVGGLRLDRPWPGTPTRLAG